ncbi:EcsC family protein [Ancylothrix sp. C2]|uniref:EcsC family protein n=1 Tax=Ancylothrix sp. D3o TaxID=2953691 RepID=UPI0021BAD513|nr:EcsC family protein [Ancylothrix sp. D3o]MCT7949472.1 EcsC family protein [Ancylothrix sp. D3o]
MSVNTIENARLFKPTICNIDGEQKKGKVLAVATWVDRQQVCFLVEGLSMGEWVPVSALVDSETVIQPQVKQNEQKIHKKAQQEAQQEAEQDVNYLVKWITDVQQAVTNKATKDIETTLYFVTESQKFISQNIEAGGQAVGEAGQEALQFISLAFKGTEKAIADLVQPIIILWNGIWVERIVEGLIKVDAEKAKKNVNKIKEDHPDRSPALIAQILINEKAIWSTATGLLNLVPGVGLLLDFGTTTPLLIQMVYEIAYAYGEDIKNPEKSSEILAILGLTLTADTLPKLGLAFLLKNTPTASWAVSPFVNAMAFLAVGYAACEYYEAKKAMPSAASFAAEYQTLEVKVQAYIKELISEKSQIQKVIDKALSVKEQLPAT